MIKGGENMESPICFELSYDKVLWGNDSRIEDIQKCLAVISISYANINHQINTTNNKAFVFHLHGITHSMTAARVHTIPQIGMKDGGSIQICLRHQKQVATVSVADDIDISILQTAMFYYMEYYTQKYQLLQNEKSTLQEERARLQKQVAKIKEKVSLLQERDMFEDDHLMEEALDQLYTAEERHEKNGQDYFKTIQSIGRLFRFQEA